MNVFFRPSYKSLPSHLHRAQCRLGNKDVCPECEECSSGLLSNTVSWQTSELRLDIVKRKLYIFIYILTYDSMALSSSSLLTVILSPTSSSSKGINVDVSQKAGP